MQMRSTFNKALLALAAVFAMSTAVAASASATLPEFKPAGGSSRFPIKFGGVFEKSLFGSKFGNWVFFKGTLSGEITGAKTLANVTITFTEGQEPPIIPNCYNLSEKRLQWSGLKGRLGYLNKTNKIAGVILEPTAQPIATCHSGSSLQVELGSVTGSIGPTNSLVKEFREEFATKQLWEHGLEGEEAPVLSIDLCQEAHEGKCTKWNEANKGGLGAKFELHFQNFENPSKQAEEVQIEA